MGRAIFPASCPPSRSMSSSRWGRPSAGRSTKRGTGCSTSSRPTAPGAPNWKATPSWRARRSCCWPSWATRTRSWPGGWPRYLVEKQLPEGGWAMYPGGGVEISGSVKAYFALKLTGHDPERRVHAAGPGGDPGPRRGRRRQQLHPLLPGPVGPDLLRTMPGRAAGDRAAAQVVSGQPLRRQLLVADDHRAAVDHLGASAGAAARAAAGHPRAVPAASRRTGRRCGVRACRAARAC